MGVVRFLIAVVGLLFCGSCVAPPAQVASGAIERGIWVTRWDYQSAADVRQIIERCATAGFDTVFFQVRGNGTVFYPSTLEPWAEEFGFQAPEPFFDPLLVACQSARQHGIRLHAWVNAVPGWRGEQAPAHPEQLYNARPEWFLYDQDNRRQSLRPRYYVALNVALPEVRDHITAICTEVVTRYPVQGLHLDYIRFLEADPDHDFPRDARSVAMFREASGLGPEDDRLRWAEWKQDQVSLLVQQIAMAARRARPEILVSAAVFRTPEIARQQVFQDWPRWLAAGWLDVVIPMQYESNDQRFEERARVCRQAVGDSRLVMGLGAYKHAEPEQTIRQLELSRRLGCEGYSLFAYASFYESPADALDENPPTPEQRQRRREIIFPVVQAQASPSTESSSQ